MYVIIKINTEIPPNIPPIKDPWSPFPLLANDPSMYVIQNAKINEFIDNNNYSIMLLVSVPSYVCPYIFNVATHVHTYVYICIAVYYKIQVYLCLWFM